MRRRGFLALLGAAATWPLALRAQQTSKVWHVGILSPSSSGNNENLNAFMQALNGLGYIDGKNIRFERRVADGNLERLPALAAELVQHKVDLILASHHLRFRRRRRRPGSSLSS